MKRVVFPFAAVLGQEKIKNALIWNLINPKIGGVLISGEKGTAKSTLVRGIADLTSHRLVEVPLNVTEDRLVGAVDLEAAMTRGEIVLEAGLLKEADGNLLYADEVNLMSDHFVNTLLETAASHQNVVEREGISCVHDCDFVLIGSMNPEEGKLRPSLLDRFGLYTEAEGEKDVVLRVEIMRRRLEYEKDPLGFTAAYEEETKRLRGKIEKAARLLPQVEITENAKQLAATLSADAHCCGHRGELAVIQCARAIAALDGRRMINAEDIKEAAKYALVHRAMEVSEQTAPAKEDSEAAQEDRKEEELSQETASEEQESKTDEPEEAPNAQGAENGRENEIEQKPEQEKESSQETDGNAADQAPMDAQDASDQAQNPQSEAEERVESSGEAFLIPRWKDASNYFKMNQGSGRRNMVKSENRQGWYVGYRMAGDEKLTDLAFDATVRAAAPFQRIREKGNCRIAIRQSDLRMKVREKRTGGCILFVVDASSSMGANRRMREVKAAILSLLNLSYQKRDRVGLIAFRKDRAELLLGITRSVDLAQKKLADLPTGGKTPLAEGLNLAYEVVMGLKMREKDADPTIVLVSDGRASGKKGKNSNPFADALCAAERIGNQKIRTIVLDTENGYIKFHLCAELNEKLNGTLLTMEELKSEGIVEAVHAYGAGRRKGRTER